MEVASWSELFLDGYPGTVRWREGAWPDGAVSGFEQNMGLPVPQAALFRYRDVHDGGSAYWFKSHELPVMNLKPWPCPSQVL